MKSIPDEIQDHFGVVLLRIQEGDSPPGARRFGEGLPGQVMKLADDFGGNTYRAAYVSFAHAVYVLDIFMKKSKTGIDTPLHLKRRIAQRYKDAVRLYDMDYPQPSK